MKLLSVMAAVRLDDDADSIENTLSLALVDTKSAATTSRSISGDPLASSTWEEVGSYSFFTLRYESRTLYRVKVIFFS